MQDALLNPMLDREDGEGGDNNKSAEEESEEDESDAGGRSDAEGMPWDHAEGMPWDHDKNLTKKDKAAIAAEKSHYGKNRTYNIIRNRRVMKQLNLASLAKKAVSGGEDHGESEKEE